jgi:hypothetical protein
VPKAKKQRVNKSAVIRKYAASHPGARPKDIAAATGLRANYVSMVLSAARRANGVSKPKRGKRQAHALDVSLLIAAKKFASSVGGLPQASGLLRALEKLEGVQG